MSFLHSGRFIMFCLKEPKLFSFPMSTQVSGPTYRLEKVINSSGFGGSSETRSGDAEPLCSLTGAELSGTMEPVISRWKSCCTWSIRGSQRDRLQGNRGNKRLGPGSNKLNVFISPGCLNLCNTNSNKEKPSLM